MGTFEVQIGVGHPAGGDFNAISAIVDTDARHSMMPGTLLERLRIRPIQTGRYGIADGSVVEYGVADARFSIGGVERYCPVIFGSEDEYLVGSYDAGDF